MRDCLRGYTKARGRSAGYHGLRSGHSGFRQNSRDVAPGEDAAEGRRLDQRRRVGTGEELLRGADEEADVVREISHFHIRKSVITEGCGHS